METRTELSKKNFWTIVINSTSTFVLSYLIVFYINFFSKIILTGVFSYSITFTHDTIFYHIQNYDWTHDSVRLIYGAGPVLVFVLGLVSLMIYSSFTEEESRIKIFFVWFALHAFNFVFSALSIGNIFKYGVGHVFEWMYLHDTAKMILALVGFFGLLFTAILIKRPIVNTANSFFTRLDETNLPFFIMAQLIVPYIFGSIIGVLYFLPDIPVQEEYSWVVMGVLLLIVSVTINSMERIQFDNDKRSVGVSWSVLFFTIVFVLVLRFGLDGGINISW